MQWPCTCWLTGLKKPLISETFLIMFQLEYMQFEAPDSVIIFFNFLKTGIQCFIHRTCLESFSVAENGIMATFLVYKNETRMMITETGNY